MILIYYVLLGMLLIANGYLLASAFNTIIFLQKQSSKYSIVITIALNYIVLSAIYFVTIIHSIIEITFITHSYPVLCVYDILETLVIIGFILLNDKVLSYFELKKG